MGFVSMQMDATMISRSQREILPSGERINEKQRKPSESATSTSSIPSNPRSKKTPPDIRDTEQFPSLVGVIKEGRGSLLEGATGSSPTNNEGIKKTSVTRLPPQLVFTFGSLPPPKANPPTPVKARDKRPTRETKESDSFHMEGRHPQLKEKPQGLAKELYNKGRIDPEFVWNPRVASNKRRQEEPKARVEIQPKRFHRSSEIPENFWHMGGFSPPFETTIKRGRISPFFSWHRTRVMIQRRSDFLP